MKTVLILLVCSCFLLSADGAIRRPRPASVASWYGEDHRGRLMANGLVEVMIAPVTPSPELTSTSQTQLAQNHGS